MRFVRKILGVALLAAGVVYIRGRRKALAMARGAEAKFDDQFGTSVGAEPSIVDVATKSGLADVDPEPRELRDRLPHH